MVPIDSLRRVEILSGLTDEQLARVASICQVVTFQSRESVVREGDPSNDLYVIHRGSVEIVLSKNRVTAESLSTSGCLARMPADRRTRAACPAGDTPARNRRAFAAKSARSGASTRPSDM